MVFGRVGGPARNGILSEIKNRIACLIVGWALFVDRRDRFENDMPIFFSNVDLIRTAEHVLRNRYAVQSYLELHIADDGTIEQ